MFASNKFQKIAAIITAALGLTAVILGLTLLGDRDGQSSFYNSYNYSPNYYYTDNASFGADFYTYMYQASDTIVDELDDINQAMGTVVDAQTDIVRNTARTVQATNDLMDVVSRTGGVITIAIGLALLAYAVNCAAIAFAPVAQNPQPEEKPEVRTYEEICRPVAAAEEDSAAEQ